MQILHRPSLMPSVQLLVLPLLLLMVEVLEGVGEGVVLRVGVQQQH